MSKARRRRRFEARLRYSVRCKAIGGWSPSPMLRPVYVRFGERTLKMWTLR